MYTCKKKVYVALTHVYYSQTFFYNVLHACNYVLICELSVQFFCFAEFGDDKLSTGEIIGIGKTLHVSCLNDCVYKDSGGCSACTLE